MNEDRYNLVLASASPRRKTVLEQMKIRYTAVPAQLDEGSYTAPPERLAVRLAEEKVRKVLNDFPEYKTAWIIGADTVIIDGNQIVGKPRSRAHARRLLCRYSGSKHHVLTGLSLYSPLSGRMDEKIDKTDVFFAPLSDKEIEWYLDTEEWRGVAGGYRIQERGACLIERIDGSYSNVMGLPIRTFYGMLSLAHFPLK